MFCDILWSDPVESEDGSVLNKYQFNHNRNCSYIFGVEAVTTFLNDNNLMSLIRSVFGFEFLLIGMFGSRIEISIA